MMYCGTVSAGVDDGVADELTDGDDDAELVSVAVGVVEHSTADSKLTNPATGLNTAELPPLGGFSQNPP